MEGGTAGSPSACDAGHGLAQDLAGTGLGQRGHDVDLPDGGDSADLVTDQLHQVGDNRAREAVVAARLRAARPGRGGFALS